MFKRNRPLSMYLYKIFCALLFISSHSIYGYNWPQENIQIAKSFGESLASSVPFVGVEILSAETSIKPYDAGEIIFINDTPEANYKVSPSVVILSHANGGVRSIYENVIVFDDTTTKLSAEATFANKEAGKNLRFYLNDNNRQRFLNPFVLLPINDSRSPVVGDLSLQSTTSGETLVITPDLLIPKGTYDIFISTYDVMRFPAIFRRTTPQRVSMNFQNINRVIADYDTLYANGGNYQIAIDDPIKYKDLLRSVNTYNLGSYQLQPGNTSLKIVTTDYSDYSNSRSYTLKVR